jgi:flagella basal body P-ring formation protein FlgA
MAIEHVKQTVPQQPGDRLDVEVLGLPFGDIELGQKSASETDRPGAIECKVSSDLSNRFASRSIVRISLSETESGQRREVGVPVRIRIFRPVWVAKSAIPAQTVLSPSQFKQESRDISQAYQTMIPTDLAAMNLNQYKARVSIRPGAMLDARQIARVPDIQRMADVRIVLTNQQGMAISVIGEALQDGLVGDSIRVRYRSANAIRPKEYMGKVVSKNRVIVEI